MKRIRKITLILLFVLLFIPITVIKADRKATCADVMDAINELDKLDSAYEDLDCVNAVDSKVIYKCNKNRIKKSEVLEDIFNYNEKKVCPSIDLSSIISKYNKDCSNEFSSKIKEVSDTVMKIFFMTAPFILIIFGSLDFFKIVTASDGSQIKKNRTNFFKRLAAFLLLYITPFIVKTLFSLTPYEMDGGYICSQEIDFTQKISTGELTGIYGGNNYGSGNGEAIVASAKEIVEYAIDNDFRYGFPSSSGISLSNIATSSNTSKKICCATLVGASLVKAGIYEESEMNYSTDSSPSTAEFLYKKGWIVIYDEDKLEPGDILFYHRSGGTHKIIDGKDYQPGHTDIYAGDGKKYNSGDFCKTSACKTKALTNFSSSNFIFALRYPGKK